MLVALQVLAVSLAYDTTHAASVAKKSCKARTEGSVFIRRLTPIELMCMVTEWQCAVGLIPKPVHVLFWAFCWICIRL